MTISYNARYLSLVESISALTSAGWQEEVAKEVLDRAIRENFSGFVWAPEISSPLRPKHRDLILRCLRSFVIDWQASTAVLPVYVSVLEYRYRPVLIGLVKEKLYSLFGLAQGREALPPVNGDGEPPALDPYRSGTPGGRSTVRHHVELEMERRVADGEVPGTLKETAEALIAWAKEQHPTAPKLKPTTVENLIRDVYRQAREAGNRA